MYIRNNHLISNKNIAEDISFKLGFSFYMYMYKEKPKLNISPNFEHINAKE